MGRTQVCSIPTSTTLVLIPTTTSAGVPLIVYNHTAAFVPNRGTVFYGKRYGVQTIRDPFPFCFQEQKKCKLLRIRKRHTQHYFMDEEKEPFTIQDAWPEICSFEKLLEAHRNARRCKRYRAEVMSFTAHLEDNLLIIQKGLIDGTYELGPYRKLWVYIPKKRLVMALPYMDRIVQWSLYQYLNPIYDKTFIEDSYACRKNKGSHKAADRLQYWMRQVDRKPGNGWYYLKLDISKYFYRVNHEILLSVLGRKIKDLDMMNCIRGIVNSNAEPFGLPRGRAPQDVPPEEWLYDVGMPIGNLTSQLFANIYLNELDQYCKHTLKIHYYIRYMDDIIILAPDKATLHEWKSAIETFLRDKLALDLNKKTMIRPVKSGVEFVGVMIYTTHRKLRKSTVRRIKREVRKICSMYFSGRMSKEAFDRRVASIKGLLEHTNTRNLRRRLNEIYAAEKAKEGESNDFSKKQD